MIKGLPSSWAHMDKNDHLKVAILEQESDEYKMVEKAFKDGYRKGNILKIERVQNKELYSQYAAKSEHMKARLGKNTEQIMYHGTSGDTTAKINRRGFDRALCGKNAVTYGRGTYFTRKVKYAAQERFASADKNDQRHIYICKVLVGDSVKGDKYMKTPPAKPGSEYPYDSTSDDPQTPNIVVIYHDAQAYPEYLISFQRDASGRASGHQKGIHKKAGRSSGQRARDRERRQRAALVEMKYFSLEESSPAVDKAEAGNSSEEVSSSDGELSFESDNSLEDSDANISDEEFGNVSRVEKVSSTDEELSSTDETVSSPDETDSSPSLKSSRNASEAELSSD